MKSSRLVLACIYIIYFINMEDKANVEDLFPS